MAISLIWKTIILPRCSTSNWWDCHGADNSFHLKSSFVRLAKTDNKMIFFQLKNDEEPIVCVITKSSLPCVIARSLLISLFRIIPMATWQSDWFGRQSDLQECSTSNWWDCRDAVNSFCLEVYSCASQWRITRWLVFQLKNDGEPIACVITKSFIPYVIARSRLISLFRIISMATWQSHHPPVRHCEEPVNFFV